MGPDTVPSGSPKLPWGVRRLFRLPGNRDRMLRDLDEEMTTHLAMRVEYLRARGMTEADAKAEALRRFGDTAEFRDYAARRVTRKARWLRLADWLGEWAQDARFARRQFAKAPAFTAIAVLTLALGTGANTAIFSVVHRLLLAPLPYPNGNRIVMPMPEDRGRSIDWPLIEAWQARARSVEIIAGAAGGWFDLRPDGTISYVVSASITANYMQLLGVDPVLGRAFTADEERRNAPVAMIGFAMWQRAYGGRRDVLGSLVQLEGTPYTIVGVTPPNMGIPMTPYSAPDIWKPSSLRGLSAFARLRPGVSAEAASRELQAIAASVPDSGRGPSRIRLMRTQDFLQPREMRSVEVLFVAVGALLLIACANVANLLLARAWTRRREFAVRSALGAGGRRLGRQVLTESVLLALAGGMLGVGVAWLTMRIIIALRPPALDHLRDVQLEPAVLLWSLGVSIATGILFGSAPALFAGARQAGDVLRNETRTGSPSRGSGRVRSGLIVLEIAVSLVLLVGAGLLVRSFVALQRMPLGFEPRGLVAVNVILGPFNRDREATVRQAIVDRVRAVPGVADVVIGNMPGQGFGGFGLETEADASGQTTQVATLGTNWVTPGYFRVAGMTLVEGRLPDSVTARQPNGSPWFSFSKEVLVNHALGRRLWPNGHVLGSRVRRVMNGPTPAGSRIDPWVTVVGVVDDVRMTGLQGDARTLHVYSLPHPGLDNVPILVRTLKPGADLAPEIERAVKRDHRVLVQPLVSGEVYLSDSLAPSRFAMSLLTAFAVIALVLSAVGLYGVIAYGVTQRTREIGVRVALGADGKAVTRLMVGGGLKVAATGLAIGVVAAAAATRVLENLLYAVSPVDPVTFVATSLLVAAITVVASYVPARRALSIDSTEALRAD
jgi:predicted permease